MRYVLIMPALLMFGCGTSTHIGNNGTPDTIDINELDPSHADGDNEICISGSLYSIHRFSNADNFIAAQGYEHVQIFDGAGELIFGDPLSRSSHVFHMNDALAINGWLAAVRPRVLLDRGEEPLTDRARQVTVCGDLEQDDRIVLDGRTYEYRLMNWHFLSAEPNPR